MRRSDETKSRIIAAAARLFHERGYANVSVQEIVDAEGITKGALYHHFSSKEELLALIQDEYLSYILEQAQLIVDGDYTARQRLGLFVHGMMDVMDRFQEHVTVYYQEYRSLRQADRERIGQKRRRFRSMLIQLLRAGIEDGVFRRDLDLSATSLLILGTVNWCHRWYRRGGALTASQIADQILLLLTPGLERAAEGMPRPALPPLPSVGADLVTVVP